jgi:hypothetical protein
MVKVSVLVVWLLAGTGAKCNAWFCKTVKLFALRLTSVAVTAARGGPEFTRSALYVTLVFVCVTGV